MVNSQSVLFALPYWYVSRVGMHPHSVACRYVYDDEQAVWFGSFSSQYLRVFVIC